jgi:eukaryotic-like serine/threonine-protein kinase
MLVGQQIGPFLIIKELGSGAMGTVYRADFHKDGKVAPVAFKIISLGLLGNEGALARFEREANILKQLRHPNIVRLIGNGKYKSTPYIVMEYVSGRSLDKVVADRNGKLSWEEVITLGKQLCLALQHAHEKGIIHRDLKPSNLMMTDEGILKLTDFGIAKDTDVTALTGQNNTIGTAAYMSPEQCKGDRNLSNKSDLYSLGVVFYELITGKKPFVAETPVDMFMKHVAETPVRPRRLCADLPIDFDILIMKLLEKNKDDRHNDANAVLKKLEDIERDGQERKSLGVKLATAKRKDGPVIENELDADDLALAKSLRDVTNPGKKKKKKTIPWYKKDWPKFVLIGFVVLSLIGLVTFLLWPEGLDSQYAKVEAAATPEGKRDEAANFLKAFGSRTDPKVDKARAIYQEAEAKKAEAVLFRYVGKTKGRPEIYDEEAFRLAIEAFEAEKKGNLDQARDYWQRIKQTHSTYDAAKLPDETETNKAAPGWVAERRIAAIKDAFESLDKLNKEMELQRLRELPSSRDASSAERLIERALLLEAFEDKAKARSKWLELQNKFEKEPDFLKWYLLGVQRAQKLSSVKGTDEEQQQARLRMIEDKLEEVTKALEMLPTEGAARRRLRHICRDIIELYEDEKAEAVKKQVSRAKELLETLTK